MTTEDGAVSVNLNNLNNPFDESTVPLLSVPAIPIETRLVGMTVPEAVGEIIRDGMDFRIDREDEWQSAERHPAAYDNHRVNLHIANHRIVSATIG
jgi:hypothetical protein